MTASVLPTDEDDRAELAAVGIILSPTGDLGLPDEQAQRDAVASQVMGRIVSLSRDIQRYEAARADEASIIAERCEQFTAPLKERRSRFESIVRQLAEGADFGPKAKSRKVTWGTYGRKKVGGNFSITNPSALLAWARAHVPTLITKKPAEERVLCADAEAYAETAGTIPPGCERIPERDEPFFKVEGIK